MRSASRRNVLFYSFSLFCAALVLIATALALATPAFAQVSFQPSVHNSPNTPNDIFQVKLSQVGKPDLITTQAASNMVSVFLNDGNGNFPASPSATYLTGGNATNAVVSADFDGDGSPDIATANCGNSPNSPQPPVSSSVSILFNNGDKTFKPHVDYPLPACPDSIGFLRAASGNSLPSLIVSYGQSTMTLLANDHLGTFSERTISGPAGSQITGVSTANYRGTNSGLDDIAAIMNGNSVVIFFAQPDGTYSAPVTIFSMAATFFGANTVGFNATGRPDLMVPFKTLSPAESGVILLANNGGGSFTMTKLNVDPLYIGVGQKAAEGDLQGTGLHSVVLPLFYSNKPSTVSAFAVFTQQSKGAWNGPIYLAGDGDGTAPAAVVADFNGDNKPDIAAAGGVDGNLFVFRNTTSASDCSFFANPSVHVCSPTPGSSVNSPVPASISANGSPFPIAAIKAYFNGTQVASSETNTLNFTIVEPPGNYQLAANAWDTNGTVYQTIVNFTVPATAPCGVPTTAGVHICQPAAGSTVSSPVAVSAAANGGTARISAMKAYIDGNQVAASTSGTITGSATEAVGNHTLTVNAWNTAGKLFQSVVTFTVH
ncbi:MAG TPA: FG-GAP-like repeat-containing protein [Candidatus Angelobacter sp.]|nr:FG-GAP-like repeat-containing protein [Candidatus Angelobacter sp.]